MLLLDELLWALPRAWGPDTRDSFRARSTDESALGQCIVSSLVIKKHLGGNLMRCKVGASAGDVHYFNELEDGMWVDSTRSQFASRSPVRDIKRNPRPELWEFKDTWDRVALLERRVIECLYSAYTGPETLQQRLAAL